MNILFIGFGRMAQALASGLAHHPIYTLFAASPSLPVETNAQGITTHHDNLALLPQADVVILAVKPWQMKVVLHQITPKLPTHALLVSVASGLTLPWFEQETGHPLAIVRAMPNLGAAVGQSATPLIANSLVNPQQQQWAEQIFSKVGLCAWIQHEQALNAFTALSGSGPAYLFLFMESMIKAANQLGLSQEQASTFTLQTVQGALTLAQNNPLELEKLRQQVTSPNGTTAAALDVFMQHNLEQIVLQAMLAAAERADQLGQEQERG